MEELRGPRKVGSQGRRKPNWKKGNLWAGAIHALRLHKTLTLGCGERKRRDGKKRSNISKKAEEDRKAIKKSLKRKTAVSK